MNREPRAIKLPVGAELRDWVGESWESELDLADSAGLIELIFERRFNRPTGLLPDQTCRIEIVSQPSAAAVWLNERPLQPGPAANGSVGESLVAHSGGMERGLGLPPFGDVGAVVPATTCFSLPVAALQSYNLLRLVLRVRWSPQTTVAVDRVALGIV